MDFSGSGDYDVNTPFKYEGDDQDEAPQSGVGDDSRPGDPSQDDLIYPPLDFPTSAPNDAAPSNSDSHMMDSQPSDQVTSNSNGSNHLGDSNTNQSVAMDTSQVEGPLSSPESEEEIPLAARTRRRPSRSTRTKKSFAEVNDEEEDMFDTKPPKGINLYEASNTVPLLGTQSIFCLDIQKERRANLTKGSKKKKKKEPEFCRFCFTNELSLTKIRSAKLPPSSTHPNTKLTTLVPSVSEIDLCLTEKWTNPSFQLVCDDCVLVFSQFYEFRQSVQTNDTLLRRLYCSSKAKSKKAPITPTSTTSPASALPATPKPRGRPPKIRDPSSDDSDAKSTVSTKSNKKRARGKRKGVTDDEDTDGYLSSVSRASKKSTSSKKGGKKKKGGATSDEETDGYMSSVSRKSNNTGSASKSKKKRRYNSDSDNEDVKSDASDGLDYVPAAYESGDNSRDSSSPCLPTLVRPADVDDDNSDVEQYPKVIIKKEIGLDGLIEIKAEPLMNDPSHERSRRYARDSDSDRESIGFSSHATHFLSKPVSARNSNLKSVLESNLDTLVNKSSATSQNYFAVIMKNYENRALEPLHSEPWEPMSDEEDKPLAKRRKKSRRARERSDSTFTVVKKEPRDKSVERKPGRKSVADESDTDYMPDVEDEPEPEPVDKDKRKKEKRERRKKKKKEKEKIKREKGSGDEMSDFAFSSYESDSSEDSMSEREMFGPIIYKCRHCDVTFRTYELLLRHLTGKHGGFESAALCYICGFYHKHKKMIYRHIKEHIEPKKMEKKVCDICSAEVIHLGTHQKVAHSGVTYNCKFCSMKFTRVGQMNIHIKTVHLKHMLDKKFTCQYCNKEFPFQGYLNKHMKTHNHHGNGPAPGHVNYNCKHCNLSFNNKHLFRNHKLVCGGSSQPQQQQQQQQNTSAANTLVVHPSTSSLSEQDALQQQLQHSAQQAAAELSSLHQIQTANFPIKLERASMYYF